MEVWIIELFSESSNCSLNESSNCSLNHQTVLWMNHRTVFCTTLPEKIKRAQCCCNVWPFETKKISLHQLQQASGDKFSSNSARIARSHLAVPFCTDPDFLGNKWSMTTTEPPKTESNRKVVHLNTHHTRCAWHPPAYDPGHQRSSTVHPTLGHRTFRGGVFRDAGLKLRLPCQIRENEKI